MKYLLKAFIYILLFLATIACGNKKEGDNKITVFHAGSLSVPFKKIAEEFKKENPGFEIFAESSGSLDAARKITDLNKECDILAVADFLVIDKLMIPKFASWNFVFASNEMIIAYTDKSNYASEINSKNWQNILLNENVIIGRSEPNADPCGYRAVFVFQLAEKFLKSDNLANKLIFMQNTVIRPKEVDLVALLETGNIDYLMIYKSVALQHNLKFVELPDEINLSNPEYETLYNTVSMKVNGAEPGQETEIFGSSILYSFTIPLNSKNPEAALKFALFLTNPDKGGKILSEMGMGIVNYCSKSYRDKLPKELVELL
ncbi:MAG TPA: extracellular solute-binding protein [Bacteroidales bacterium]|nr:extracellular solute-binding protein [Bacteroidales bacterium]